MDALEFKAVELNGQWLVMITKQKYRSWNFYYGNCVFEASNGFKLCSEQSPDIDLFNKIVFVRGVDEDDDEKCLQMNDKTFCGFRHAVIEYNKEMKNDETT